MKLQKVIKNKNKLSKRSYNKRYDQIMSELYPILRFIQYTQINKKVVHLNSKMRTTYSNLQEGYGNYQEDLVQQQIERMIDYIPKIDTTKKISNVLFVIQVKSTRIYFYSTIISPKLRIYSLDTDNESNNLLIDNSNSNYSKNKYDNYEQRFQEIQYKIYFDYYFNRITYIKFLNYTFLIHMIYFFIKEDKYSDQFIELYTKRSYNTNHINQAVKLIKNIYKIYKKNIMNKKQYTLKIGAKTIENLIQKYFN